MKDKKTTLEGIFEECYRAIQEGHSLEQVLGRYPEHTQELREKLETALWLEAQKPALAPRTGFLSTSRQRVLDQIHQERSTEITRPQAAFFRRSRLPKWASMGLNILSLVALVYCLAFITFQLSAYAEVALPGDRVYVLKQIQEKLQLTLTSSPEQQARLHVDFAQQRSSELEELILEGRFAYLGNTARDLQLQVEQANQLFIYLNDTNPNLAATLTGELAETFATQNLVLNLLIQSVPLEARSGVETAMQLALR